MRTALLCSALIFGGASMAIGGKPAFLGAADLPARPAMPAPLTMLDGSKVGSPDDWNGRRKPELMELFQHYMYGFLPPAPRISAEPEGKAGPCLGGKGRLKQVAIRFGPKGTPPIHLLVIVPAKGAGPVPTFLGLNFHGNHVALDDPSIVLPTAWMPADTPGAVDHKATDAGRGKEAEVWSVARVIDRGYGLALFYSGDLAPDHPGFADGVFPAYGRPGQSERGPDEWGAVAAWAWGMTRAFDYLATDPDIDARRIVAVGHSRMGKASLLAGAFDDRIALTIAHQAGCGGSAPSRGIQGEQVRQINDRFPHWFDGAFKAFNDRVDRLPIDQNCLIALAAPRPVLLTNAADDAWADPTGQFEALKGADPAYRLLGVAGIDPKLALPPTGRLVGNRLNFHIRPGKHSMTPDDWTVFLQFADRHLGRD